MKKNVLLAVALFTLSVAGLSGSAQAQESRQPYDARLPDIVGLENRALLKQGSFDQAKTRCSAALRQAPLVAQAGELSGSYLCLAESLFGLGSYPAAAVAYRAAIEQLTTSVGVFDPRLVSPLQGLGKTLLKLGKSEEAEGVLSHAKDLIHRNFGIYNLAQADVVNTLSQSYIERGEVTKANREQKFLLRANEEAFGEAPQLLPALRRFGKWQERLGRPDLARMTYRRALSIMDRAYGTDDLRRAGPLRDYARSYLNTPRVAERVMSGAGARALTEVVNLYKNQEYSDAVDVAKAWAGLGDWYIIGGRRRLAYAAYVEAGKALDSIEVLEGDGERLLSWPVEIEYEDVPINIRPSRLGSFPTGILIMEFEFTVTASGRVMNLAVLRDDLNWPRFAVEVGQRVKASRYRPRVVNGTPVDTQGVKKVLRYDFSRRSKEVTSDESKPATKAEDEAETLDGEATPEDVDDVSGEVTQVAEPVVDGR